MSSVVVKMAMLFCYGALMPLIFQANAEPQGVPAMPTIIMIEKTAGRPIYKLDSKPVGHAATDNILYALQDIAERNGKDHPVYVYLDSHVPIQEIWNLNGIAGKAQLDNLRYFVLFRENQMMTEVKWTPFRPFTTSPPAN